MVVWQLTENKSFKCTPIFHSAQLPVNQSTCKQTVLLEYKIERDSATTHDSATTKTVFYLPLWYLSDE